MHVPRFLVIQGTQYLSCDTIVHKYGSEGY